MASQAQAKPVETTPLYTGPIFDADTHFWETDDAWSAYLSEKTKKDWGISFKTGADGDFAMYVGPRKVEISADHLFEDGRVPAPGKLHEWLRAMKEGKAEIDMHVAKTADMMEPAARVAKLDGWDVRSSILFVGNMITAIGFLDEPVAAYEVLNAYNHWMYDQWRFNYNDHIFTAPIVTLADVGKACEQVKWCVERGAKLILMPMGPYNGKAPAHPDHDPFWSIVNEAGLRVVFHVSEAIYMKDHMAVWGEPVGVTDGGTFAANRGRNVPIKVTLAVDGVVRTNGDAVLTVVPCGGGTGMPQALTFGGGRWNAAIDTGRLAGTCHTVSAAIDGLTAGAFTLDLRGGEAAKAKAKGT